MTDRGHALRADAHSGGEHQVQTEVGEIAPAHREVEGLEQPSYKYPGDAQSAGHPPPHAGLDDADLEPEPIFTYPQYPNDRAWAKAANLAVVARTRSASSAHELTGNRFWPSGAFAGSLMPKARVSMERRVTKSGPGSQKELFARRLAEESRVRSMLRGGK